MRHRSPLVACRWCRPVDGRLRAACASVSHASAPPGSYARTWLGRVRLARKPTKIACQVWLVSMAVAIVALSGSASSWAHFQTYEYTLSGCPASSDRQVDPVNFVFWSSGSSSNALSNVSFHAGWANTSGTTQYFSDHNVCRAMDGQRASGGSTSSRFHIRVEQIADSDPIWGTTSRGDAHHEDFVWTCLPPSHAVDKNGSNGSGFDQGRRELRTKLEAGGHAWESHYWGNTRNFQQCDGDYAGSDGYTVFVQITHRH